MFRGIDPEGLTSLANTVDDKTSSLRLRTRPTLELLHRNGRPADAAAIGAAVGRIEQWGAETGSNLRWRAGTIESGQAAALDICATTRAQFAAAAVFSLDGVEDAYRRWVEELQAGQRRTDQAVADISGWLDQRWTDWDVTSSDLHNIWNTLDALSDAEFDRVLMALSPAQLGRWIEEMGNSINGFSRDEKQRVFAMLANNAAGEPLGKVHDAIMGSGSQQDAVDVGMAIRQHSADQVIVDFVTYGVQRDLARHRYSGVALAVATDGIEDPAAIDETVRAIVTSEGALDLIVVDSLVTAHIDDTGDSCAYINPLDSLIQAMGRGTEPELLAVAFVSIAGLAADADDRLHRLLGQRHGILDTRERDLFGSYEVNLAATQLIRSAEVELLGDATHLLITDTDAVLTEVATRLDRDAALTTAYFHQLLDHDLTGDVGRIVDSVRGGDTVDSVAFSQPGSDPNYPYPHAQNLAHIAGSLSTALRRYADESKRDIDLIDLVAKMGSLLAGPLVGGATYLGGLAQGAIGLVSEDVALGGTVAGVKQDIDDGLAHVTQMVESVLRPQLPLDDEDPILGEALLWWLERYDSLTHPGAGRT